MDVTRTYLQLTDSGQFRPAFGKFPDLRIVRATRPAPELYRRCYRTVGAAFHWRDRWDWSDEQLAAHLGSPNIRFFVATRVTEPAPPTADLVGWYELRCVPDDDSVEIAYFGILRAEFGRGLGKHLLSCAVRDAWALAPRRVWLHTCTLDHPHALPNYVARGFAPYRTEAYEVDSPT